MIQSIDKKYIHKITSTTKINKNHNEAFISNKIRRMKKKSEANLTFEISINSNKIPHIGSL